MKSKKLMINLSCGHTIILGRFEAGRSANGNYYHCPKCPWHAPDRRAIERSWVAVAEKEDTEGV